jgi:2-keto-3-deoxy-6-phosphogluconate aldolase
VLKELKKKYGSMLLLASGAVTTADQAAATIDAGLELVVSPSFHPEVIAKTHALGCWTSNLINARFVGHSV